jgi:hypothetical protein
MAVTIRSYRPGDHSAGRRLWVELTERHRTLYDDPGFGGADPGAAFEDYLTRLDLSGMWVADHSEDGVVGLVGLIMKGRALGHVADEARRRGLAYLTVAPESRNVDAIRSLHAAGYDVLSALQLTLDLGRRDHAWRQDIDIHELRFRS